MLFYSLVSLISFLTLLSLAIKVFSEEHKRALNILFFLFCSITAAVAFVEFLVRISESYERARLFAYFASIWPLAMTFFLHFTLILTVKKAWIRRSVLAFVYPLALMMGIAYFRFIQGGEGIVELHGMSMTSPLSTDGMLIFIFLGYPLLMLLSFLLLLRHALTPAKGNRKDIIWLLAAYFAALVTGLLINIINSFSDLHLAETTGLSYLLFALIVFTGIQRRNLIILTPRRSANTLLKAMDDLVFLTDSKFLIIDVNEAVLRFLNCRHGETVGKRPDRLLGLPEDALASNRSSIDLQSEIAGKEPAWLRVISSKVDSVTSTDAGYVILVRDITQDRKREEELINSLADREQLLREVHHRVNNSLQVIISILRLRRDKIEYEQEAVAINEAIERIMVISHLYQQLYASESFSAINVEQMIHEISGQISTFDAAGKIDIIIHSNGGVPPITLQKAVPLGLVLLELITNACRHAYPGGLKGKVNVSLEQISDGGLKILIEDSGIGFAASGNHVSGGLAIANGLAQQINAKLVNCSSGKGTHWELSLPFPGMRETSDR